LASFPEYHQYETADTRSSKDRLEISAGGERCSDPTVVRTGEEPNDRTDDRIVAVWVNSIERIILDVRVPIAVALLPARVCLHKPTPRRRVHTGAVVIEAVGFGIDALSRIGEGAGGSSVSVSFACHPAGLRLRRAQLCAAQPSRPSFFVSPRSVRVLSSVVQPGLYRNLA
jgi:hypothetical protein